MFKDKIMYILAKQARIQGATLGARAPRVKKNEKDKGRGRGEREEEEGESRGREGDNVS